MKTLQYIEYGLPEKVLKITDVEKPVPQKGEVLIKIHSTTTNDYDWSAVQGKPFIYRLLYGLKRPKKQVPGMELSGVVEKAGDGVKKFSTGDAVYGDISNYGFGTFAEYICINENAVVKKPADISFEIAAALPHASLLALQALRDVGKIKKGEKILINGAGGGVGTIGIGIARSYNCEVTGVDSGDKLEMLKRYNFDHVIDYRKEDFTRLGVQYDLILDCKTSKPIHSYLRSLKPGGRYVTVGGNPGSLISLLLWGRILTMFSKKKLQIVSLKPNHGLGDVEELYRKGDIQPVIDGPYTMIEIPQLIQYFGEGKHKGKIVINMMI